MGAEPSQQQRCGVLYKGESMNQEMKRIMEALMLIYGRDLQAATITVLLKDGDTGFRFLSSTFPQVETEK